MSTNYDDRAMMTPERRAEVAGLLGMDNIPTPRYDDLPDVRDTAWASEKFQYMKALQCVDSVASAVFMGQFFHPGIPLDQAMDARTFKRGWSQAALIDCSKQIPVNAKITAATGITKVPCEKNWYGWLSQNVKWIFDESGARAMSPVLIFRARGLKKHGRWVVKPLIGALYKLDRTPAYGRTELDMVNNVGILHPTTEASKNRRLPIAGRAPQEGDPLAIDDPSPGL